MVCLCDQCAGICKKGETKNVNILDYFTLVQNTTTYLEKLKSYKLKTSNQIHALKNSSVIL